MSDEQMFTDEEHAAFRAEVRRLAQAVIPDTVTEAERAIIAGLRDGSLVAVPEDATAAMVTAALAVDWENENEEAIIHNVWHAMLAAAKDRTP